MFYYYYYIATTKKIYNIIILMGSSIYQLTPNLAIFNEIFFFV